MAATQSTTAIRSYRIYFRDARNSITASHEVDLPSDDEARGLAALMLDERNASYSAEVWDRTRHRLGDDGHVLIALRTAQTHFDLRERVGHRRMPRSVPRPSG